MKGRKITSEKIFSQLKLKPEQAMNGSQFRTLIKSINYHISETEI